MVEGKLFDIDKLIKLRRTIHQNPELAFEEVNTSAAIIKYLKELGIQDSQIRRVAKTGILVDIYGKALPVCS
jgi:metal-dependent amidase/aminoacylase/carboxypeptidase family protein